MFLTAPETKGFTLEEMDDVFDTGRAAWKGRDKTSRLETLAKEIEEGKVKVHADVVEKAEERLASEL